MLRKLPVAAGPRHPQPRRSEPRLFAANAAQADRMAAPDPGVMVADREGAPGPAPLPVSDGERRPVAAESPAGVLRYAILGGLAALVIAALVGVGVWRSAPPTGAPAATEPLPPSSAKSSAAKPANPLAAATPPLGVSTGAASGAAAKPAGASDAASLQPPPAAALPKPSGSPPAEPAATSASPAGAPASAPESRSAEPAAPSGSPLATSPTAESPPAASKSPPATAPGSSADLSSPSGAPSTGSVPPPGASAVAQPAAGPMPQSAATTPVAPPAPPLAKPTAGNHRRTRTAAGPHRAVRTREMARHHREQRSAHTARSAQQPHSGSSLTPPRPGQMQAGQSAEFDRLLNNLTTPGAAAAPARPAVQSLSPPAADAPDPFAGRAGD